MSLVTVSFEDTHSGHSYLSTANFSYFTAAYMLGMLLRTAWRKMHRGSKHHNTAYYAVVMSLCSQLVCFDLAHVALHSLYASCAGPSTFLNTLKQSTVLGHILRYRRIALL
jgi:hypothetical protein